MRCDVPATHVKNVIIWGNHSSTQYPDVHHCVVNMSGSELACFDAIKDEGWLKGEFITVSLTFPWLGNFEFGIHLTFVLEENPTSIPTRLNISSTFSLVTATFFHPLTADCAAERCCSHQGKEAFQRHVCSQGHLWPHERYLDRHPWGKCVHCISLFFKIQIVSIYCICPKDFRCVKIRYSMHWNVIIIETTQKFFLLVLLLLGWICLHGCLLYWQLLWGPRWPHLFISCPNSQGETDLSLRAHCSALLSISKP